jgi:SNF2 family DNA or RNA helicase
MYKWTFDNGFKFDFDIINHTISTNEPQPAQHNNDDLIQIRDILQELVDNSAATRDGNEYFLPTENIYGIGFSEWIQLNLPDMYPYSVFLSSDGALRRPEFRLRLTFCDFWPGGNTYSHNLEGPLITVNDYQYMLSPEQYSLVKEYNHFNSLVKKVSFDESEQLKAFAKVKTAAKSANAFLHDYIQNENIVELDRFGIDINYQNDILEVRPVLVAPETWNNVNIDQNLLFLKTFDRNNRVKEVYSIPFENSGRTRVVVGKPAQVELTRLKNEYRKISSVKQQELFLKQPASFMDPEIVDFEVVYSDRVLEIAAHKPKYYPFVCPYKSEWLPGIVCEKDGIKTNHIIRHKDDLKELKIAIDEAESERCETITYRGESIDLPDAKRYHDFAVRQLNQPDKRLKTIDEHHSSEKVLVIIENAEENSYQLEGARLIENVNYSFEEVEGLQVGVALKDYQMEGVTWLQTMQRNNRTGGLLADDMGLGKTLQVLYFIEWLIQKHNVTKPILIIAPVALLENWEEEYLKFFPKSSYPVDRLFNSRWLSKFPDEDVLIRLNKPTIFLANYETYRNYQLTLGAVSYAAVILDEAQRIKTPGTMITNAVKAVKSDFHIALTGTPVENSLVDLWCIVDFVAPGLLGSAKEFAKKYDRPLSKPETNIEVLTDELRRKIGNFLCRRLKKDVLQHLPEKREYYDEFRIQMPEAQLNRYKLELELATGSIQLSNNENDKQHILKTIRNLKHISEHPYLVEYDVLKFETDELINTSAKLIATINICDKIKSLNEKVILFTDSKLVQAMLRKVFRDRYLLNCSIINGDTPAASVDRKDGRLSRQQTIKKFAHKQGFNIIIMSPLAAGVGLNVTAANHVIHYSRHWNPAKEQQATDRAYRIGQEKNVHVYFPFAIAEHFQSFDETLHGLLNRKKELAIGTLFPTERIEVSQQDVIEGLFGATKVDVSSVKEKPLTITDLDKLSPDVFEAAVGSLYKKQGYDVDLTSYSGDFGADVVALGDDCNYLIQCKRSSGKVDNKAVQEIVTAKNYYERSYGLSFELIVATNSFVTQGANQLALDNRVFIVDRVELSKLLIGHEIFMSDIQTLERTRFRKSS